MKVERVAERAAVVALATGLERHGDATAALDIDGTPCTYRQLARRADEVAERLGATRRLVLVEAAPGLGAVVAVLGAWRGGHVVLLAGADTTANDAIVDAHDPDVVIGAAGDILERRPGTRHELHPELALLLSTSGSTGSPKLVRLSAANVDANAEAIATYLELRPTDRAIAALPLQYCYGLSVVTSHLAVGASVACTDASVVDPCFWQAVDAHGVTNLAGVPHTFELLERAGFPERSHPSLRFLTQAGGRMAPEQVRRWAQLGERRGFDLYVMYGQTEATARMAYLPPSLAERHPDAVGVPVPGGSFRIEPVEGGEAGEGELVYAGPNVMLGYAEAPADLALGRTVDELRTGDLARIDDDGLVRIVGRRREILKVLGLRIDLRRIRELLSSAGVDATCTGDDDGLVVAVHDATPVHQVRRALAEGVALPAAAIAIAPVDEVPRLASGKVDAVSLVGLVRRLDEATGDPDDAGSVSAAIGALLGVPAGPDDTFVSLGGDSLTYVEASIALEQRVGTLPTGWHVRPLRELDGLAATPSRRRRWLAQVETGVVLRALAIVLVVANHTGLFLVGGGAHLLLAAAGFNMARFQLRSGAWGRSIGRMAVPAMVWIGGVAALTDDFDLAHALLVHGWAGGPGRWAYWFVEVLAQLLAVAAVLTGIPAVRRFEQRHPFGLPTLLLAPTLAVRFDVIELGEHHRPFFRPHEVAWMFVLGWMAAAARTTGQRLVVSAATLLAVPGFFGNGVRECVLAVGLLVLLWVPTLPVPRGVPPVLAAVAGASLHTYLSHVQVHPLLSDRWPAAALVLSLAVGLLLWRVTQPVQRRVEAWLSATASGAGSPGASPPPGPSGRARGRAPAAPGARAGCA